MYLNRKFPLHATLGVCAIATLVACGGGGGGEPANNSALPPATDGVGTSYSSVPKVGGGTYDKTECVKDSLTGLTWEGKPSSGTRAATNGYTNYDSTTSAQVCDSSGNNCGSPTQLQIDAATNTLGYVKAVNAEALCGYTDWRLPTADELQSIVDYTVAYPGPTINTVWFPNTPAASAHWSSSAYVGDDPSAWLVNFYDGSVYGSRRSDTLQVRLVR
jgi:hypothetical protein